MSQNCGTYNHFENESLHELGGLCLLSQSGESKLMIARDEMSAHHPYLEVSPEFGCNQHQDLPKE